MFHGRSKDVGCWHTPVQYATCVVTFDRRGGWAEIDYPPPTQHLQRRLRQVGNKWRNITDRDFWPKKGPRPLYKETLYPAVA